MDLNQEQLNDLKLIKKVLENSGVKKAIQFGKIGTDYSLSGLDYNIAISDYPEGKLFDIQADLNDKLNKTVMLYDLEFEISIKRKIKFGGVEVIRVL